VATACALEDRYSLSWWDSLIVASAIGLGCDRVLTEDLQDGPEFEPTRGHQSVPTRPWVTSRATGEIAHDDDRSGHHGSTDHQSANASAHASTAGPIPTQ
jgi:hypothetical protein